MTQKHFSPILPWAFWNPRREVQIIVLSEKLSILYLKGKKSITIAF